MINQASTSDQLQADYELYLIEREKRRRQLILRIIELFLWAGFSLIALIRVINIPLQYAITEHFGDILLSSLIITFPILFFFVFESLPLEEIRRRVALSRKESSSSYGRRSAPSPKEVDLDEVLIPISAQEAAAKYESSTMDDDDSLRASEESFAEAYASLRKSEARAFNSGSGTLSLMVASSEKLAKGIYTRSGLYLIVGILVAFSGLLFFYTQTSSALKLAPGDQMQMLLNLAPKTGILLFIEFIAFFFLKQYRASMDDYKYFEAIKRHREELLMFFIAQGKQKETVDLLELVKLGQYYSPTFHSRTGQGDAMIGDKKLDKEQMALMGKIVDAIIKKDK